MVFCCCLFLSFMNPLLTGYKQIKLFKTNSFLLEKLFVFDVFLPINHKIPVGYVLAKIYGIGMSTASKICWKFGLNSRSLPINIDHDFSKKLFLFFNYFFFDSAVIKSVQKTELSRFQKYVNYKGFRHLHGLPSNGQRTRSNAKTSRSLMFHNKVLDIVKSLSSNA